MFKAWKCDVSRASVAGMLFCSYADDMGPGFARVCVLCVRVRGYGRRLTRRLGGVSGGPKGRAVLDCCPSLSSLRLPPPAFKQAAEGRRDSCRRINTSHRSLKLVAEPGSASSSPSRLSPQLLRALTMCKGEMRCMRGCNGHDAGVHHCDTQVGILPAQGPAATGRHPHRGEGGIRVWHPGCRPRCGACS